MSALRFGYLMQLKPGNNTKYGIPYMGSKTKLIEKIAKYFPNADNFYDLFGGGFSVTHYMLTHRRKSYKNFYFNEIRPETVTLIKDAIAGKYNYDVFKPAWISREEFMLKKSTDAYIRYIWSFGNNGEDYIFGKEIENEKRSMHMAVVFDQFDDWIKTNLKIDKWPNNLTITGKRLYLKRLVARRIELQQLERLEQLERLQQLEQLQQLQQLELSSLSYEQVNVKDNSVIYCDIPYKGTADYSIEFDHEKFFDWAHDQRNPVFISEYNIEDKRFSLLKEINKVSSFSLVGGTQTIEKLYGNHAATKIIMEYKNKNI